MELNKARSVFSARQRREQYGPGPGFSYWHRVLIDLQHWIYAADLPSEAGLAQVSHCTSSGAQVIFRAILLKQTPKQNISLVNCTGAEKDWKSRDYFESTILSPFFITSITVLSPTPVIPCHLLIRVRLFISLLSDH